MVWVHLQLLLIAMLPTLPNTVLCIQLPPPVNLSIDSHHFIHLLRWQAGPGSPEAVSYNVNVTFLSKEGRLIREMAPCSPVPGHSPLRCNLTEVLTVPEQTYYIIVSASSGNLTSPPVYLTFQPFKDTIPEAPLLKVLPCNKSLCVHLEAPSDRVLGLYNCTVFPCFNYKLNISTNGKLKFSKEVQGLQTMVLDHLVPGQQYCVSIGIKNRTSSNKPSACASTSTAEPSAETPIFVVLGVIVLLFLWGFVMHFWIFSVKTHLPFILSSFQSPYKEQLMDFPTVETHAVSLELHTVKGIKRDEEDREEDPEDESVAYERLGNPSESSSGMSEPGISSIPPFQGNQSGNGYDRTHDPTRRIFISPVKIAKSCSPEAPKKYSLKTQHSTGCGLQQKTVNPPAGGQIFSAGLPKQLGQKNLSLLGHRDKEEQKVEAEEGSISVNLFSLTLGGSMEDHWEKEETRNMEIPELVTSTSLQRIQENSTDTHPTCSPSSDMNVKDFEEEEEVTEDVEVEEEEEEEEEEENSGYLMRN